MNEERFVAAAAAHASAEVLDRFASGELAVSGALGGIDDLILGTMNKFFDKYGPSIASRFEAIAAPAAHKAGQILGPVIEEKLKAETPRFALITGAVVAGALLVGGWFARREVRKERGRRRGRRRVA